MLGILSSCDSLRRTGFSPWALLLWSPGPADFSGCSLWAQEVQLPSSRAQAQYLWDTGLVAPGMWDLHGSNPRLPHGQADSPTRSRQLSPVLKVRGDHACLPFVLLADVCSKAQLGGSYFN